MGKGGYKVTLHNTLYKYLSPSENFISTACLVPVPVTVPGKHAPIPTQVCTKSYVLEKMQHVFGDDKPAFNISCFCTYLESRTH